MCIFTNLPKSTSFLAERLKFKFVANLRGDRAIFLVSPSDFQFCFLSLLKVSNPERKSFGMTFLS